MLLVLTSITLITLDFRGFAPLERARSGVLSALSPVGDAAGRVFRPLGDAWDGAFEQGSLAEENAQLRQEIDELRGQVLANDIAQQSLRQLLEQADLPFVGELETVQAQVVSGAVANFDRTIEIDRGTSSGVRDGMAVVTGGGLVGKVVQASGDRAVVELLSGGGFQVAFTIVGSNVIGTARGQGDGGSLRGTVDVSSPVEPGEILVTDGIGGRSTFPQGLPVGTVTDVRNDDGSMIKELDVQMLADLSDLRFVRVVLWEPAPL